MPQQTVHRGCTYASVLNRLSSVCIFVYLQKDKKQKEKQFLMSIFRGKYLVEKEEKFKWRTITS